MAVLTDTSLERLGGWIERNVLKDECTIMRNMPTRSSSGGEIPHWAAVHDGLSEKCTILDTGTPAQAAVAAQEVGYITKTAIFARGKDVRGNDRIVVGPVTYTIIDIFEPSSFEIMKRALVRRSSIQGGV